MDICIHCECEQLKNECCCDVTVFQGTFVMIVRVVWNCMTFFYVKTQTASDLQMQTCTHIFTLLK